VLALLVVSLTACSGDASTPTGSVEFGEGEIPETVPDDFPIPPEAVIGATLVDPARDYTEVILRVRAELGEVALYYEQNLGAKGWEVTRSEPAGERWEIEFTRSDDPDGSVELSVGATGVTQAVVTIGGT
jgi:hypothetical protein